MKLLRIGVIVYILLATLLFAKQEDVTLLLKWTPQFQFAGFYMAKEKGFYQEVDLNVNLVTSINKDNISLVENQPATYGIFGPKALINQAEGRKIRVISAIFQNSPLIFLSLANKHIIRPEDIKGKRILANIISKDAPLSLLLKSQNILPDDYILDSENYPTIQDLINNKTDLISAYLTDAPYQLQKLGYKYNIIDPIAYGINFYGDLLFTSSQEIQDNPSRVKRFINASIKGWQYALENIDETIEVLQRVYKSPLSKDTLINEAQKTKELILPNRIPIGTISDRKILNILEAYKSLGKTNNMNNSSFEHIKTISDNEKSIKLWQMLKSDEKAFLSKNPTVNLGILQDKPPFYFKNQEGKETGILIDITKKIENIINITFHIKPLINADMQNAIQTKKVDMVLVNNKYASNGSLKFLKPLVSFSGAAFSKNKNFVLTGIKDLYGKKIIIEKDSIGEKILKQHKEITLISYNTLNEQINALLQNKGDILITILPSMNYKIKELSLDNIFINGIFYKYPQQLAYGVRDDLKIFSSIMKKAMDFLPQQEIDYLARKWLNKDGNLQNLKLTAEQKAWIQNKKELILANDPVYPPYDFLEDGKATGFSVELLKILAKKLGLHVKIVTNDWDILLKDFKNKKIDLLSSVYPDTKMKDYAIYSKPYLEGLEVIITNKENQNIHSLNDLNNKRISIPPGYEDISELKNNGIKFTYVEAKDSMATLQNLVIGKADATIMNLSVYDYLKNKSTINSLKVVDTVNFKNNKQNNFHFAVQKEQIILKELLDKALKSLPKQTLQELRDKWFIRTMKKDYSSLQLDDTEKKFLKSHQVIRVGTDRDWAPFDFSKNGKAQGYSIDFYKLLENELGIRFEFVNQYPWNETLNKFRNKEVDMLSLIGKNKERESYTLFSDPILSSYTAFALRKGESIQSVEELINNNQTVGVIKDFWIEDILQNRYPNLKIKEYTSALDALKALSNKQIDAYIDSAVALSYQINRNILANITLSSAINIDNNAYEQFHLGIRKDWKVFYKIIQKAISNIDESKILELQRKWFGNVLEGYVSKQALLNSIEKKFLLKHKNITFGIDTSWAPFDYIDSNNNHEGIVKEISDYLLKENLGIKAIPKQSKIWSQHIEDIKNKKLDMIAGIVYTKERAKKMLFTNPYLKIPLVIVGNLHGKLIDSLNELNGETVGVVEGYYTYHVLKEKYPNITIKTYKNVDTALISLSKGNVKYFFDTLPAINYVIKNTGITNLKLLGKSNEKIELSYGVRQDWPELVTAINKMIQSMSNEKKNQILNKWINLNIEKTIDYSLLWKVVLGFLALLSFIIYWNRKLSREIAQRKIVEIKLKDAQFKAENANRAKSEFLSNMSHEIRTPMNAVIGFAELTAKMDLPSKALSNINIIQKSAKALIEIINDILDLSKIEAGKLSIQNKPTNIKNIAEDLYAVFSLRAENKGIFFDISFDNDAQKALIVDEVRIRQVLINLIGNAIKFTHVGSVKVNFKTIENKDHDELLDLHVSVKDTGIGIESIEKEKVFGMFEQQSTQDNKTYGGTGLGLSISLKLANLMGGTISLQSKINEGSTFTLIIPKIEIATSLPQPSLQNNQASIYFNKATILIVDDIQENLDLLENILEVYDFDIIKTDSGSEAISLAEEKLPDIILMDIKMPHVDGYQASQAIRKNTITSHIPIIAVSASVLNHNEIKSNKSSFDDFIPKPINLEDLESSLAKFLSHTRRKIVEEVENTATQITRLTLHKNDKEDILSITHEFLNTGDLFKVKELIKILQSEESNEQLTTKLDNAITNIDIDIVETELLNIISDIEKGEYNEL